MIFCRDDIPHLTRYELIDVALRLDDMLEAERKMVKVLEARIAELAAKKYGAREVAHRGAGEFVIKE